MNQLLRNYWDVHRTFGTRVTAVVYVTDPKHATFRTDWGEGVAVEVKTGDAALAHDFAGECRREFSPERLADARGPTHYLFGENDVNVTADHIEALCEEFRALDDAGLGPSAVPFERLGKEASKAASKAASGDEGEAAADGEAPLRRWPHPTLVRFDEIADKTGGYHRVLVDNQFCHPPQVDAVRALPVGPRDRGARRTYVTPHNPYAATWFVPRDRLRAYVAAANATMRGWRAEYDSDRENHPLAYLWEDFYQTKVPYGIGWSTFPDLKREWHAGYWFRDFTEGVVPRATFGRFLVHHRDHGIKAAGGNLFSERAFLDAADAFEGEPVEMSELGYEPANGRVDCAHEID
jgi:hypothetical protein